MEIWKDIKGYEGHYQISNTGKVKALERLVYSKYNGKIKERYEKARIMCTRIDKCGYEVVRLTLNGIRKNYSIHRLMAIAFIPNQKNKPQVNHKNGIKSDNSLYNLEWCSNGENQIHANKNNLRKSTFKRNVFIPKEQLLKTIGNMSKRKAIAIKYGVSTETVRRRLLRCQ